MNQDTKQMQIRNSIECWIIRYRGTQSEALLLKGRLNRSNQTFWQPITGGIEEGETHTEACIREVKEETGIKLCEAAIEELDFTLDVPISEDKWIVRKSLFVVESTQEDVVLSSEHEGFRWAPFRDVLSYLIFDSNKQTFAQILRWIENQIPNR